MDRARAEMAAVEAARAGGNPLERNLFPPELIMRRQRDIGLRPEQRQQITQAIGRLEASLVELQWNMQEQQQALADALEQSQVDVEGALRLLDRVLATEAMVKRTHFQALLQIRGVLTPEQQDRLRAGPREPAREEER
jgi:Spy/CpxP family protein refolding chaperone